MRPLRLINLVPKDGLGEVWVKVAVELSQEEQYREAEITAKLTEAALKKIDKQGLQTKGLCLLTLTQPDLPEQPFHVVATLEEKEDRPLKIYHTPCRTREPLNFRLLRGERG